MSTFDSDVPGTPGASTGVLLSAGCRSASPCLPAIAPSEKCRDSPRNPRGAITMSMIGVHPTSPGDMHGRVHVQLRVGLAGTALRLLHAPSMHGVDRGRPWNRSRSQLTSLRGAAELGDRRLRPTLMSGRNKR